MWGWGWAASERLGQRRLALKNSILLPCARRYPGRLWDLDNIAGFRWYDTRVMTILSDITFANFVYQPELGSARQSVWYSMVQR